MADLQRLIIAAPGNTGSLGAGGGIDREKALNVNLFYRRKFEELTAKKKSYFVYKFEMQLMQHAHIRV